MRDTRMQGFIDPREFVELVKRFALEYGSPTHEFVLKSGARSHFYLDLRKLTLSPGNFFVSEMLDRELRDVRHSGIGYHAIGGPETGANQIVGGYMAYLGDPTPGFSPKHICGGFVVRKAEKGHGKAGRIVGNLKPGDRAVLVEDVTTTGGSVLEAIEAVREFGAEVVAVITICDRQQGAQEAFRKAGVPFRSICTQEDLKIEPRKPGVNAPADPVPEPEVQREGEPAAPAHGLPEVLAAAAPDLPGDDSKTEGVGQVPAP
jgi:orotate phosphoribosyltransferase